MPHSRCNEHPSRIPLFEPFPALTSKIPDTERVQYLSTSPLLLPLLLFGDPVLLYHPNTCPFYLRVPRRCSICGVVFFAHGLDHGMIDVHCALPASGQCISPGLGLNILRCFVLHGLGEVSDRARAGWSLDLLQCVLLCIPHAFSGVL